jgi:hypothetical protein
VEAAELEVVPAESYLCPDRLEQVKLAMAAQLALASLLEKMAQLAVFVFSATLVVQIEYCLEVE